jgi:hypothetical protein
MSQENKSENTEKIGETQQKQAERRPNEQAGFYFSGFVKITDLDTGKVLLHTRTD